MRRQIGSTLSEHYVCPTGWSCSRRWGGFAHLTFSTYDGSLMKLENILLKFMKFVVVLYAFLMLISLVSQRACCPTPQSEDVKRMRMLKKKFPEYSFDFDCEFYIRARARSKAIETQATQEKLEKMYRCFFMDESGEKRVGYVYLSYYDSSGEF